MYSSSFRLTNRDIDLAFEAGHLFLAWRAAGRDWPLSINLGASDLADMGLPGALDEIVGERGLDPASFTLEVPEGAFARHGEEAQLVLSTLRRLGFRTALDGGGAVIVPDDVLSTAYFDEVKIGGASIIQFARRLKGTGLGFVGKRVSLAASRGLAATAVGVEDETTLLALSALGFTAAQGTHLCRPMAPDELARWSPPALALVAEEEADGETEEEVLLLVDPMPEDEEGTDEETYTDEASPAPVAAQAPIVEYSWEDVDPMIPAEEVRGVAWRLDRVCLFPDRHLLALVRRPRVLPHTKKEKSVTANNGSAKPAPLRQQTPAPKAAKPRRAPARKHVRASLVTRPSLVQIALGF